MKKMKKEFHFIPHNKLCNWRLDFFLPKSSIHSPFIFISCEIQKYQQSTELIKKLPFERLVREIAQAFLRWTDKYQ
ncbi:hypothetical protein ES332_D07G235800v1 [Gossypium tomentosum]|uniref:Histone H2A/H2B/H3 domain-containing protein n=1 Tax=Gossypium tomentosum TaxID=34277 RepID=A0A5D2KBQ5_GOSTO|nr:hypothetical protein ES332_D07G235800v1 [Gossypium tomentosum]